MAAADYGSSMLSKYPADKLVVSCDACGLSVQYDKLGMVETGGDRPLGKLLIAIVRRNGCTRKQANPAFDKCGAIYANWAAEVEPEKKPNAYARAKGG